MTEAIDFETVLRLLGNRARADVACPLCGPARKQQVNRTRKVLRIWSEPSTAIEGGTFVTYCCARCEAKGTLVDRSRRVESPPRPLEAIHNENAELAQRIWAEAIPIAGTPAEAYLSSRQCYLPTEALRFHRGDEFHRSAMIASFHGAPGIHLTKLTAAGRRPGTERDKYMLGPSAGHPIIVADASKRSRELYIAEGIEDAATLAIVTGASAWAAGSASRIPAVVVVTIGVFEKVYVAIDADRAGEEAIAKARFARADVIDLHIAKALGREDKLDANRTLVQLGADILVGAIRICEARTAHAQHFARFNGGRIQ